MKSKINVYPEERFYLLGYTLSLVVWSNFSLYRNSNFKNEWWHCLETWSVSIGLLPELFQLHDYYYDGHYSKGISILGLNFSFNYTYDADPLEKNSMLENEQPS